MQNECRFKLTPCAGQQDEPISLLCVIVYLYDVKCAVCKKLYINTLYSNSDIVGVFIANRCTVVYH